MRQSFTRRWLHPVLAWLGSTLVSAVVIVLTFTVFSVVGGEAVAETLGAMALSLLPMIVFIALFVITLTALPWLGLVWLMHWARVRRGLTDTVLGGLMGAGLIEWMSAPVLTRPDGWLVIALFLVAGMAGGQVYWQLAGRPR